MTNPIVQVNVSQVVAPTPNTLQKKGALISQGATNIAPQSYALLTQMADLTPLLTGALPLTSLTWSGSVVTAVASSPHGFTVGDTVKLTIAGVTPAGYNGTYDCLITNASQFTFPLSVNPGVESVPGVYTPEDVAELVAMATTFFAQGASQSVYVLELGAGNAADGVTALTTFINASAQFFYSYLVPRYWDADSTFLAYLATFEAPTKKTYFFVTTTTGTYTSYSALLKDVLTFIEAPGIPATEFSAAAAFYAALNYNPSTTNKVAPFAYQFLFGVTPYPTKDNAALITALQAAFVNIVGTGAEGGISDAILLWGTTMDGNDFTYWYSVDWVQINVDLNVSNAVINGSNNPVNPLYYNQNGIDRLQAVAAQTMQDGVTFGLVLGDVVQVELDGRAFTDLVDAGAYDGKTAVNAVPFIPYSKENPGDYKLGKYAGFAILYTPARGFKQVIFNVIVSQFVAA